MKDKYRDLRNSIVNTSKIYREPLSNTYLIDFLLGNKDGTALSKRSIAENYIEFHKLSEAAIVENTEQKFIASTKKIADLDAKIAIMKLLWRSISYSSRS